MTAKEMFEKLGYKKVEGLSIDEKIFITYKKDNVYIGFSAIDAEKKFEKWEQGLFRIKCKDITIKELKAINKQCEELDWFEEGKNE